MVQPQITLIFPLYQAENKIDDLVTAVLAQKAPNHSGEIPFQVLWIDNASTDQTVTKLRAAHARLGSPAHWRIEVNPQNLGLSRSLNRAFELTQTPFALTCHADCRFASPTYVAEMLHLLETHPQVAAITGTPSIPTSAQELPTAETVNLITNLMDLFPNDTGEPLNEVGFAEGRCDGFRIEALRKAGFYDTNLSLAGEDQVLAARLRKLGYRVCQAPKLTYFLSVSAQQDSLFKLAKHHHLFGKSHPYVLFAERGTSQGAAGAAAGSNRRKRTLLRLTHLFSSAGYFACIGLCLLGQPLLAIAVLAFILAIKLTLFAPSIVSLKPPVPALLALLGFQPVYDVAYTLGFVRGIIQLPGAMRGKAI